MNKTAIKNFAVWARRKLISDITYKAGMLGVTENGIAEKLPQSTNDLHFFDVGTKDYVEISGNEIKQRAALVSAIKAKEKSSKSFKEAFEYIVEEVAYTWFNRLIAIRFMEVNDYLPSGIRVLSSENKAKNEPDFVTNPFDTDLEFTPFEQDRIIQLKDENKLDELFRMLFIKQCNKLHEILPELFEETDDYTELLLTISFTDNDGVVYHLVHDIAEDDFNVEKEGQVEIIGWLYQYYNIEPKDKVFANLKKNIKISKENIPAATQLFTPDWIVRYMVENSLGRLWVEHCRAESGCSDEYLNGSFFGWKYYLEEAEQEPEVEKQLEEIRMSYKDLRPEDIKVIDPCMGSGHILVYAFDVLMQIYESCGYTQRDAVRNIIANNIYGLDIDERAYQLAYFAVMMKARQYNRRILTEHIKPNLFAIQESNEITNDLINFIADGNTDIKNDLTTLCDELTDAKEYGSILNITQVDFDRLFNRIYEITENIYDDIFSRNYQMLTKTIVLPLIKQAKTMAQKYDVVVTNPPYMGASGMSAKLSQFVKDNYHDSKSDLFAVFIERCKQMTDKNCYQAMITQHAWMFLSSFEKLRIRMLTTDTVNMAHLGARAFDEIGGEVVQTTSFVMRKSYTENMKGTYCRLVDPTSEKAKEDMFLKSENRFFATQNNFSKIPGSPIAYWVSNSIFDAFSSFKPLKDLCHVKNGMSTTDNNRFLRHWFECEYSKIGFNFPDAQKAEESKKKWFPYNKGGEYRKYYGNIDLVVNWENNGKEIKKAAEGASGGRIVSQEFYFMRSLSWSKVTAGQFVLRLFPEGFLFDVAGPSIFSDYKTQLYILGLMNSKVKNKLLQELYPTINYEMGQVGSTPIAPVTKSYEKSLYISENNIDISKCDWDSFETSWDFKIHPLVEFRHSVSEAQIDPDFNNMSYFLKNAYEAWEYQCQLRFDQLKSNEEELNRIFIDIYGLQDELTPEVEDKDVTVRKADLQRDIKSLISYAVGCMFGRYSIYKEGLMFAGGEWNTEDYKYAAYEASNPDGFPKDVYNSNWFLPDEDNCIPITDEEYFEDDIVGRFVKFIETVYGKGTLEENLDFIAKALGNKGSTSREVIRNYFLNDFIKDHIKIYQKRPIYWMFDSGKQNGFKALCYMHRWDADTTGNMRVEYLHRTQRVYEKEIERMQEIIDNGTDNKAISAAIKRKEKLQKQLKETKDYDALVAHLALSRIDIDLDDGVKVNYEKVQTTPEGQKMQILTKI